MEKMDFYRELRERIHRWAEQKGKDYKYLEYLLLAPDFFYLLVRLIMDERVPFSEKARLGLAIAYFISPIDIVPEGVLGPAGYADDLVLAVWTVNHLLKSVDRNVLIENWPSEKDLFETMERIISVADQWLGSGAYQRLKNFFSKKAGAEKE